MFHALGDLGVSTLADAVNAASPLYSLDLASNSVGEVGAMALARAMERGALPSLTKLSLKNNDVNDRGVAGLRSLYRDGLPLRRNPPLQVGLHFLAAQRVRSDDHHHGLHNGQHLRLNHALPGQIAPVGPADLRLRLERDVRGEAQVAVAGE